MKLPKPDERKLGKSQKMGIALIFISVMIFSAIGIAGFQALSHWNSVYPIHKSSHPKLVTDSESASSFSFTYDYEAYNPEYGADTEYSATETVSVYYQYIDLGQAYTMSYSTTTGITGVNDYFNGASISTSTTPSYTPSSTGTYDVGAVVTSNDGNSYGTTDGMSITVEPALTVSVSSSGGADVGQQFTLTASASGGYGSYSYQWYSGSAGSGSAISGATSSTYTTSESSSGTYDFYVEVTDDTGNTVSSSTYSQTVDSDPSISIYASHNPSDAGQAIDFSTSVSGGTGSYTSYSYILYDGTSTSDSQLASGSSSSFSYTFSTSGSYLLTYSVTDSNGYTATSSLTQNVNTDLSVTVASSQNPTDSGNTVEFTSSVSGGTPGYSYSWSVDGNTYTSQDINVSFSSSGSYSVQLTVTDAAGYSVSQSLTETVNSDPTVSASSNVSSADLNYPIEFSSTPSGGTGSYSYSWTLNGQQISTSQDFSYSFASSGSYTLTVTITDSVGVQSSASVTVTINSNPSVSVSSSQNPADVGNSVTFSSSESGGTGTDTYVWYINGVQESTASSFSYSFSAAGTYYVNVTVTDSDGHSASYSLKETVNPDPSVTIHIVHNPTDVGIWANFSSLVSGGTGPFSYSWTINGQTFTTAYVNYTFTASGTFPISLTVTDANGNTASASVNEVVNPDPTVAAEVQYLKVD